jgi:hypothetical protein
VSIRDIVGIVGIVDIVDTVDIVDIVGIDYRARGFIFNHALSCSKV